MEFAVDRAIRVLSNAAVGLLKEQLVRRVEDPEPASARKKGVFLIFRVYPPSESQSRRAYTNFHGALRHESWYEKIIRMPDGLFCYDPPEFAAVVNALLSKERGYVTFGSMNQLAKVRPEVIGLWSRLQSMVPTSRILFRARALNDKAGRDRLSAMRATMREKISKSPLLEGARFAKKFSKLLRAMWTDTKVSETSARKQKRKAKP
jgi:hypothetical protein